MGKNWHKRFLELDGTPAQAAAQAFQARLEDLQLKLAEAEAEKASLEALLPDLQANFDESLLMDAEAQLEAKNGILELLAVIDLAEQKIKVLRDTINCDRISPQLETQAAELWDLSAGFRAALVELFPSALKELAEAQDAYLRVVSKVGEIGRAISRLEQVMNGAASPFLTEKRYQGATPLPAMQIDPQAVLTAYDPTRKLALGGINPEVLSRPKKTAYSALETLKGE